jgi:Pyridoxamine 5'-phosphate oxidase
MSAFTNRELDYLRGGGARRLARIATLGSDGTPHVVPVGFRYDPDNARYDGGAAKNHRGRHADFPGRLARSRAYGPESVKIPRARCGRRSSNSARGARVLARRGSPHGRSGAHPHPEPREGLGTVHASPLRSSVAG